MTIESQTELKALTMLRSAELTSDMETEHLKILAAHATEVEFMENQIIYRQGSMGSTIYLIEAGEVILETDEPGEDPVAINTLGPGQFFGWSALFPEERKMARSRATKPTRAIAIDAAQVRAAWQADHKLEYAMIRRVGKDLADRIRNSRQQLVEMLKQGEQEHGWPEVG